MDAGCLTVTKLKHTDEFSKSKYASLIAWYERRKTNYEVQNARYELRCTIIGELGMGWNESNILKDTSAEYSGRTIELGNGTTKLDIVFREDEQLISFSRNLYVDDTPEYKVLVQKIAKAFDEELKAGKHQEHFGRIVSETKRILEL